MHVSNGSLQSQKHLIAIISYTGLVHFESLLLLLYYNKYVGKLFFLILPGISYLDSKATGKMGVRAIIYYIVTTFIAVIIGILMVTIIRPGKGQRDTPMSTSGMVESVTAADAFLDLIR